MLHEQAGEGRIEFDAEAGRGAIVFDRSRLEQARPEWFDPVYWGEHASAVSSGGRGAAWYIDAPFGDSVLRHYRRGGLAARVSRGGYVWQGEARVRSVLEFRLARELLSRGLAVPTPLAAWYVRSGMYYRAALLMEKLPDMRTFADLVAGAEAPWEEAGRLIARAHRTGLDHADLNASNLLFDRDGNGWVIDLDRGLLRAAGIGWRYRNLERLKRSLLKLHGERDAHGVEAGYARLRRAYEEEWSR